MFPKLVQTFVGAPGGPESASTHIQYIYIYSILYQSELLPLKTCCLVISGRYLPQNSALNPYLARQSLLQDLFLEANANAQDLSYTIMQFFINGSSKLFYLCYRSWWARASLSSYKLLLVILLSNWFLSSLTSHIDQNKSFKWWAFLRAPWSSLLNQIQPYVGLKHRGWIVFVPANGPQCLLKLLPPS